MKKRPRHAAAYVTIDELPLEDLEHILPKAKERLTQALRNGSAYSSDAWLNCVLKIEKTIEQRKAK